MSTLQTTTEQHELSAPNPITTSTSTDANSQYSPPTLDPLEHAPPDAITAVPDGGYGWTIVTACAITLFWINGYTTAWGVLQTAILKSPSLHTNVRTITFVGSLYMACMVAFGIASIRVMRAFGIRATAVAATLAFGLGLVATSFTLEHLGGLFCVAGVLVGVATSLLYTATNSMPLQWFSARLGIANGLVKAGGGVWVAVDISHLGILVVATGVPCALVLKERSTSGSLSRFDWSLLKNVSFLTLTMAGAVGVFALFVPPFFLPLFASSIGLSASTGAGLVGGFGAATAVGRVLGGWTCDRMGAFNTMLLTCLLNSVSMLAIWPVSTSLPPLFIFAIVNGCANGSFFVALPTAVAAIAPQSAAASISLMVSFWTPGYLLGAPLAGILIEATGAAEAVSIEPYRAAIFYAAGTGVLATLLIAVARFRMDAKMLKRL
ncbi:hypothetical protein E8E13_002533 [Curvularia kusanoi]|uniref:Major facilitator superfamily (MFS) profile domain-containing protein n=1 Tax=Curvularia kusanoi TaxID=90978 RepID=A0A9P4T738_CURKU|nr:hypothetical protein E8E13_002533 [Curvularia kusanoi]